MRQFYRALRSDGVSAKIGRFAISLFLLSVVMTIVAGVSVSKVNGDLSSVFDVAGRIRNEQLAIRSMLGALVETEVALLRYGMSGDEGGLSAYRDQVKRFGEAARRFEEMRTGEKGDYAQLDRLTQASVEELEASAKGLATLGKGSIDPRRTFEIPSLDLARAEQIKLDGALSTRLSGVREQGRRTATLLFAALSFLALGLVLLSFAQLRDLVMQTARFLRSEERAASEIGSLEEVLAKSRLEIDSVHRQLAITLHSAGVQVFTVDAAGTINWVADSQSRIAPLNVAPCSLADLVTPDVREELLQRISEVIQHVGERSLEARITTPSSVYGWVRLHLVPQPNTDPEHVLCCAIDISELKQREQNTFWLMRELSHRSKNLLAVVQSMAGQTARSSQSMERFLTRFASRLRALAASHDLLVDADYAGAPLDGLIRSQLFEVASLIGSRVQLSGPDIMLRAEAAQTLGMAMHELCANAVTHGALKDEIGKVDICWFITGESPDEVLVLDWVETTGTPIVSVSSPAFGETLIKTSLDRALGGDVSVDHRPTGTVCQMRMPLARLQVNAATSE